MDKLKFEIEVPYSAIDDARVMRMDLDVIIKEMANHYSGVLAKELKKGYFKYKEEQE
tara:strand:+ start:14000 stop:14170 length:171 start_codon:yes stop_codon:yes gene_type:complete